jgi:hypothetical protein
MVAPYNGIRWASWYCPHVGTQLPISYTILVHLRVTSLKYLYLSYNPIANRPCGPLHGLAKILLAKEIDCTHFRRWICLTAERTNMWCRCAAGNGMHWRDRMNILEACCIRILATLTHNYAPIHSVRRPLSGYVHPVTAIHDSCITNQVGLKR